MCTESDPSHQACQLLLSLHIPSYYHRQSRHSSIQTGRCSRSSTSWRAGCLTPFKLVYTSNRSSKVTILFMVWSLKPTDLHFQIGLDTVSRCRLTRMFSCEGNKVSVLCILVMMTRCQHSYSYELFHDNYEFVVLLLLYWVQGNKQWWWNCQLVSSY